LDKYSLFLKFGLEHLIKWAPTMFNTRNKKNNKDKV